MLDKFHYHEVLDRIHVMQSMLEDHIQSHHAVIANQRLAGMLQKAQDALGVAYQVAGELSDEKNCLSCAHRECEVFEDPCYTCDEFHKNWAAK